MGALLKMKTCEADVVPDISVMKKMASLNGTIPSRILELVDNSVDARIPGTQLEVHLNILKRGSKLAIEVIDNGAGMEEEVAKTFFQLGKSQKTGEGKIGRFGLGSKIAILGLGNSCKISTSPVGKDYSIDIDFDIQQFKDWKIKYNVKNKDQDVHGTRIRIDHVTVRIGDVKRFCERLQEHLSKTYKHFIESEAVVIYVNNQRVSSTHVELLPELHQKFDFNINGKRVYGWAGAMKEAGTNWKFGFDLISNGRIIKVNDLLSRQAHTSLARLVGEVHLDDYETDIHKTDFLRYTPDFQVMQEHLLNEILGDLIIKVSKLTNKEVFEKFQGDLDQVSKTLNRVIRSYDFLSNIDIEEGIFKKLKDKAKPKAEKKDKTPKEVMAEAVTEDSSDPDSSILDELGSEKTKRERKTLPSFIINEPVALSLGEEYPLKRWSVYESDGGVYLTVEVNLDHPTYQSGQEEAGILIKNSVMDSVAEFILQEEKKQRQGLIEDEIERLNLLKDMLIRHSVKNG